MTLCTNNKLNEKFIIDASEDYIVLNINDLLNRCRRGEINVYQAEFILEKEIIGKVCEFVEEGGNYNYEHRRMEYVNNLYIYAPSLTINFSCNDKWVSVEESHPVTIFLKKKYKRT
jgi:hypothetical protein